MKFKTGDLVWWFGYGPKGIGWFLVKVTATYPRHNAYDVEFQDGSGSCYLFESELFASKEE